MRAIGASEFDKLAQEVVDGYLHRSVPLADGVVKTAIGADLNPDQVQNLVQLANTMAHLTLFDGKSDDKIIDLVPADPDIVLKKIYKGGVPVEESVQLSSGDSSALDEAMDMFGDFPDLKSKLEQVASGTPAVEVKEASARATDPRRRSAAIIKLRKVAEELKDREIQAALEYKDELDKLASEFARLHGPSLSDFEKDAFAIRGQHALEIIKDVRNCLRMPAVKVANLEKHAGVIDAETSQMKSLDRMIKLAATHRESQKAHAYIKAQMGGLL